MKKIDMMAAFNADAIAAEGVNNVNLTAYIIKNAKPFGHLFAFMKPGCGIAVIRNGDTISVIGVELDAGEDAPEDEVEDGE